MKSICLAAALSVLATAASAEIKSTTPQGFEVVETAVVAAPPAKLYQAIAQPSRWWSSQHTFSGSAANLTLDPHVGGCFCETLKDGGAVQHLLVVYVALNKMLRLRGALGPLQGEAVEGTLTFNLAPTEGGTTLTLGYIVGGYFREGPAALAAPVDGVLKAQTERLKRYAETGSPEPGKP